MTYRINKTDGNLLIDIPDGILDTESTGLTLIGRNVTNFGEAYNENLVKLLENFASVSQPEKALRGQLWYDTSAGKLKVFDGNGFRSSGGPIVEPRLPESIVSGDLWIDTTNKQLRFFDGSNSLGFLAGPIYTAADGESGFFVERILDTNNRGRTIVKLKSGGNLLGIFTSDTFRPLNSIDQFTGNQYSATTTYRKGDRVKYFNGIFEAVIDLPNSNILPTDTNFWREVILQPGFTAAASPNIKFNVTATRSEGILTATGEAKLADQILYNDEDGIIVGSLNLQSNNGLTLGGFSNVRHFINENRYIVQNEILNSDISINVKNTVESVTPTNISAIYIKANSNRIGLFNPAPTATLDVNGDVVISGNLTVGGTTTTINSTVVEIEDKNIVLGNTESPTDLTADGGGLTLKATLDKTLVYERSSESWSSSENLKIAAGKSFIIGSSVVLDSSTLGSTVTVAEGLTTLTQTLEYINIDQLNINNNTISNVNVNGDIVLSVSGSGVISVSNTKIVNLANPTANQDAATKFYVDTSVFNRGIALTFDVTGIGIDTDPIAADAQENLYIVEMLELIAPVYDSLLNPTGIVTPGAFARIQTTALTAIPNRTLVPIFNSFGTTATASSSSLTLTLADSTNVVNGLLITGNGIPDLTYVTNVSGNIITINRFTTSSLTNTPVTFSSITRKSKLFQVNFDGSWQFSSTIS
jgi:hypothetical protein